MYTLKYHVLKGYVLTDFRHEEETSYILYWILLYNAYRARWSVSHLKSLREAFVSVKIRIVNRCREGKRPPTLLWLASRRSTTTRQLILVELTYRPETRVSFSWTASSFLLILSRYTHTARFNKCSMTFSKIMCRYDVLRSSSERLAWSLIIKKALIVIFPPEYIVTGLENIFFHVTINFYLIHNFERN